MPLQCDMNGGYILCQLDKNLNNKKLIPNKVIISKKCKGKKLVIEKNTNIHKLCLDKKCKGCENEIHVVSWYIDFAQFHLEKAKPKNNGKKDINFYFDIMLTDDLTKKKFNQNDDFNFYNDKGIFYKTKFQYIEITLGFHEYIYHYQKNNPSYRRSICNYYKKEKKCLYDWNCLHIHVNEKNITTISKNDLNVKTKQFPLKNISEKKECVSYVSALTNNNNSIFGDNNCVAKKDHKKNEYDELLKNECEIKKGNGTNEKEEEYEITIHEKQNHGMACEGDKKVKEEDFVVELNVGGMVYMTLLSTLKKDKKSKLYVMFQDEEAIQKFTRDKENRIFIDRDGELFRYVLEYLRNINDEEKIIFMDDLHPVKIKKNKKRIKLFWSCRNNGRKYE